VTYIKNLDREQREEEKKRREADERRMLKEQEEFRNSKGTNMPPPSDSTPAINIDLSKQPGNGKLNADEMPINVPMAVRTSSHPINQYFYERRADRNESSQLDELEKHTNYNYNYNNTIASPLEPLAGCLSPSNWGGANDILTQGGINSTAYRTMSSSGYREKPCMGNSNLMRRTGNLKDVNDV